MSDKMNVVYLDGPGHVLAAVETADGSEAESIEALTGQRLPLRSARVFGTNEPALEIRVPAEVCAVKTVAKNEAVIADPRAYVVDGGTVSSIPPVAPPGGVPALTEDAITIPFIGGGNALADTKALALVSGITNRLDRAQEGTILTGDPDVDVQLELLPGETAATIDNSPGQDYAICYAVEGFRLAFVLRAF